MHLSCFGPSFSFCVSSKIRYIHLALTECEHIMWLKFSDTWHSKGPFLALQRCTGQRALAHTGHVHSAHLELVEDVLLQVLSLKTDENR